MRPAATILSLLLLIQFALIQPARLSAQATTSDSAMTPSNARNLRAATRYQYMKANEAQNKMSLAENENDVDGYVHWLGIMRKADTEMHRLAAEYYELRDYLEAKIWNGELEIHGFNKVYEKGVAASIVDHLLFRVRH